MGLDYKSRLNEEQIEAVETTEGSVLIIAGAGAGKTTTLIDRTANIIDKGCPPERILMLTFTNKAANEMKERGSRLLDDRFNGVVACTYHSFCANILRKYAACIGIANNFTIADSGDVSDLLSMLRGDMGFSKTKGFPRGAELATIFSAAINKQEKIVDIIVNEHPEASEFANDIIEIYKAFVKYKFEKNIMDYDDLISHTNRLFRERPDIGKNIADAFLYIMVDEYQDSNLPQLALLMHLRSYENKNICAVGDDQQSIYFFRGAQFKNIINFPKHFAPCKLIILNKNYRSNQEILDLSNAMISMAAEKYEKNLVGFKKKGSKPCIVQVSSSFQEAEWIYKKIKEYVANGTPLSEIAVLSRGSKNTQQLEMMFTKDKNMPYNKFGGIKFLERAFVKDIFAYLKILSNIHDEIAWFRVLQLYPNIGEVYAKRIFEAIEKNGVEELLNPKYNGKKYGAYLSTVYDCYTKLKVLEFDALIPELINKHYAYVRNLAIDIMNSSDAVKEVAKKEVAGEISEAQALVEMASGYKSIEKFLTDLTLEASGPSFSKDAITISTIHSAKGLEFKVVFIVDCVDGVFPWNKKTVTDTPKARENAFAEYEEERRVLYVALTRAKDDLYIMWPDVVTKFGTSEKAYLSSFLTDWLVCDEDTNEPISHDFAEIVIDKAPVNPYANPYVSSYYKPY